MNWRSNKKFFVASLQANVNFQKNGLIIKNQKKKKKSKNMKIRIYKNQKKNPQKKSL